MSFLGQPQLLVYQQRDVPYVNAVVYDEFEGGALKPIWGTTVVGAGSTVSIFAVGTFVLLFTGAGIGSSARLHWGANGKIITSTLRKLECTWRLQMGDANQGVASDNAFGVVTSDFVPNVAPIAGNCCAVVRFGKDVDAVNWQHMYLGTSDGFAYTQVDTLTDFPKDTNFHEVKLVMDTGGVSLFLDGRLIYTKTTNIPNFEGGTLGCQPYLGVHNDGAPAGNFQVAADYCFLKWVRL